VWGLLRLDRGRTGCARPQQEDEEDHAGYPGYHAVHTFCCEFIARRITSLPAASCCITLIGYGQMASFVMVSFGIQHGWSGDLCIPSAFRCIDLSNPKAYTAPHPYAIVFARQRRWFNTIKFCWIKV